MPEIYVSTDVETDGPIPGPYSMISLGMAVAGRPDLTFYTELRPISDEYVPDAEPQRFDTQTGEPLEPVAERGTTGREQTPGQHATTRDPLSDPLTDPAHDTRHGTQQPPEGTQTR